MKNLIVFIVLILPVCLQAQTQGKIVYEEYMELKIELPPEMQAYADQFPSEQRTQMDLFYNTDESMYVKSPVVETAEEDPFEESGGFQVNIRMGSGGEDSRTYYNRPEGVMLRSENVMGKKFLVTGEVEDAGWKITGNAKDVLGYHCLEATLDREDNVLTAWFAPEITVPVGPQEFRGLPGAILELHIPVNDTQLTITALSVEFGDFNESIVRPDKGKKVTQEEFEAIMEERLQEMGKMYGGEGEEHESGDGTMRVKIIRQ